MCGGSGQDSRARLLFSRSPPSAHDGVDAADGSIIDLLGEIHAYSSASARDPGMGGVGLIFLVAIGCSQQEELKPDPGVSPFYPGPTAERRTRAAPAAGRDRRRSGRGRRRAGPRGPLRPEDVERQLRIALRAAEKGDSARAVALLDRILALEPANREALLGRAADRAGAGAAGHLAGRERLAALEKAGALVGRSAAPTRSRTSGSSSCFATCSTRRSGTNAQQGRYDRAVAVLKEAYEAGFEPSTASSTTRNWPSSARRRGTRRWSRASTRRTSPGPATGSRPLRPAPQLRVRLQRQGPGRQAALARPVQGEGRAGRHLGHLVQALPQGHPRPGPALPQAPPPRLRDHRPGLSSRTPRTRRTARQYVKQFVQESGIPYPIAMGDERSSRRSPTSTRYPDHAPHRPRREGPAARRRRPGGPARRSTPPSRSCWPSPRQGGRHQTITAAADGKEAPSSPALPRPSPRRRIAEAAYMSRGSFIRPSFDREFVLPDQPTAIGSTVGACTRPQTCGVCKRPLPTVPFAPLPHRYNLRSFTVSDIPWWHDSIVGAVSRPRRSPNVHWEIAGRRSSPWTLERAALIRPSSVCSRTGSPAREMEAVREHLVEGCEACRERWPVSPEESGPQDTMIFEDHLTPRRREDGGDKGESQNTFVVAESCPAAPTGPTRDGGQTAEPTFVFEGRRPRKPETDRPGRGDRGRTVGSDGRGGCHGSDLAATADGGIRGRQ